MQPGRRICGNSCNWWIHLEIGAGARAVRERSVPRQAATARAHWKRDSQADNSARCVSGFSRRRMPQHSVVLIDPAFSIWPCRAPRPRETRSHVPNH